MVAVRTSAGVSMLPGCKRFALLCVGRAGEPVDPDFTSYPAIAPIPAGGDAMMVRLAAPFIG
jgi:hypothetical protein